MRKPHQVDVQRQATSQDSVGQIENLWTTTATIFVNIVPVSGREFFAASGERAEVTHKIYAWYGPTIVPRDRISFGGRIFDIKSVINIGERNKELELMCTEVV
jgi:SPP1 family predicted phage head-tail adaptor